MLWLELLDYKESGDGRVSQALPAPEAATQMRTALWNSPLAISALASHLGACANEAASLAHSQSSSTAGKAVRMDELAAVERRMADSSALIFMAMPKGAEATTKGWTDSHAAATQAVPALSLWWKLRGASLGASARLDHLLHPNACMDHLACVRLMPRTLMCCAALLAACNSEWTQGGKQTPPVRDGGGGGGGSHGLPLLSVDDLQRVSKDLVLSAVHAGCCISLCLMEQEDQGAQPPSAPFPSLGCASVLEDFPGDAEECWKHATLTVRKLAGGSSWGAALGEEWLQELMRAGTDAASKSSSHTLLHALLLEFPALNILT
eukprot:gene7487-632_t